MTNRSAKAVRVNQGNLAFLPIEVQVPRYNRKEITESIVHIGVGGFHRAHQAAYLDDLLQQPGQSGWGICGIGLLKPDERMRDALRSQDYLYSLVELSASAGRARVIGSLLNFLYAPDHPQSVIEKMASPECKIVSLTITEGGYYVNQSSGRFEDGHPDIVFDLAHPKEPRCSFGYLAEALDRRRKRGLQPFTVMSCDNLQHNGDVARSMLLALAGRKDPGLRDWIESRGSFPNSMVDRITPATTDEHRLMVCERFGLEDSWPVITEPFRQWVIEDNFPNGRPEWERAGAQMTSDVLPYEKMKIRLLNASHQAICHAGRLMGYQFVHEAIADPLIERVVRELMDVEVTPLLPEMPGIDLYQYRQTLIDRFGNPVIKDPLSRIGMEGSARMPKFILPSITEQLERGGPIRALSLVVACWFRCLSGTDDQGRGLELVDPLGDQLREQALIGAANPGALFGIKELFSEELRQSRRFVETVATAMRSLYEKGARATLADLFPLAQT